MKHHRITLAPKAIKQLADLPKDAQELIRTKIDRLENDLSGDVKRMKSFSPAYRMRAGNYRVLFDVVGDQVIIGLIGHRRDVYDR